MSGQRFSQVGLLSLLAIAQQRSGAPAALSVHGVPICRLLRVSVVSRVRPRRFLCRRRRLILFLSSCLRVPASCLHGLASPGLAAGAPSASRRRIPSAPRTRTARIACPPDSSADTQHPPPALPARQAGAVAAASEMRSGRRGRSRRARDSNGTSRSGTIERTRERRRGRAGCACVSHWTRCKTIVVTSLRTHVHTNKQKPTIVNTKKRCCSRQCCCSPR